MANQTWSQSLKSIAGAALLAVGFLMLFANLDAVAGSLADGIGHPAAEGMDSLLAFGLAAIHAVQTYMFENSQFVSAVHQILVSFWPSILIIVGAVCLRDALGGLLPGRRIGARPSAMGDRW